MDIGRSLFIAIMSLFLGLFLGGVAAAQSSAVPLRNYESLVRECHAAAQRHDIRGLRAAGERVLANEQIELPSGEVVAVDNSWLREALDEAQPDMDQLANRLGALVEVLDAAHENDPQALAKLHEILSRPPFAEEEPSWLENTLRSIARFFVDLLEPIGEIIGSIAGIGNLSQALLTLIAVVALVGAFFYIARLLRGTFVRKTRVTEEQHPEEEPATSTEAAGRAEELASDGDYRSAVRYLYLSTLLWLHERGMLRYDRALTNYEVLQSVPANSPLRTQLQPVVSTFDRVWYGHHQLDTYSFEQYRQQVTALRGGQL